MGHLIASEYLAKSLEKVTVSIRIHLNRCDTYPYLQKFKMTEAFSRLEQSKYLFRQLLQRAFDLENLLHVQNAIFL